jgi:hypothetical protein
MINVDKDGRHPVRRLRQSSKLSTFIFSLVRDKDRESPCGIFIDEIARYTSEDF